MTKKLISPQVYSFETDESGIDYSPYKNRTRLYSGEITNNTGTGVITPENNENSYILLETGFYLLQEDGSKIIL